MAHKSILRGALLLALLVLCGCQQQKTAVITLGGDVMLARDGGALFDREDPWGDAATYMSGLRESNPDSLFMVNLESPLSMIKNETISPQGYNLCADAGEVSVLKQGKVNLVSLANNHKLDCSPNGMAVTQKILEENLIQSVGFDLSPVFITAGEVKIAVIAAEDVTALMDEKKLIEQIHSVRSECDLLIISIHWGNEYQTGASDRQKRLAQEFADAGADVVWGHHPHVLQPMTWLDSSDGSHRTLVFYSLGNLLTDQGMSLDTEDTALVTMFIKNGKIVELDIKPLKMNVMQKKLEFVGSEEAEGILDHLQASSSENVVVK